MPSDAALVVDDLVGGAVDLKRAHRGRRRAVGRIGVGEPGQRNDGGHDVGVVAGHAVGHVTAVGGPKQEDLLGVDAELGDDFVDQGTLTHAIAELRAVLGDDARSPQYIETITKRGYRLMETVEVVEAPGPSEEGAGFECAIVHEGRLVVLSAGVNVIGRAADVAIRIDLGEISRRHAHVGVSDDGVTLEDLGSKNGTHLWGQRLAEPARLSDGDEIAVGPLLLVLRVLNTMDITRTAGSVDEKGGAG